MTDAPSAHQGAVPPPMSPANSPTGSVAAGEARLLEILTGMQQNQQVLTEILRSQQEGRESSSSSGLAAKDLSKVFEASHFLLVSDAGRRAGEVASLGLGV